jgi:hypothetical protein
MLTNLLHVITVPYSIAVSQTTEFFVHLVTCMTYISECFFSVQQGQLGKMHYAYGAGQHAGLSIVLDTKEVEYFAPLQPMTGIWVRHFWFLYHALLLHVHERPTNASNSFKVFIPLFVCSYMFWHHLCHLQGAYMCLSYLHLLSRCW